MTFEEWFKDKKSSMTDSEKDIALSAYKAGYLEGFVDVQVMMAVNATPKELGDFVCNTIESLENDTSTTSRINATRQ